MQLISVEKLVPNSYNPNEMSEEDFQGLVESIRNAGFLEANPILARPLNGSFEIVDGEHRWKASKQLGLKEVPCDVREMDDLTAHRLCVILNKDRGAPDYFRLSKLFNEDIERGVAQNDLAKQYGYNKVTISQIVPIYPRLYKITEKFDRSNFTNKDILMLARVENDLFRYALVERAVKMESLDIQTVASRCNKIADYIDEKTEKYLFSWDEIPGKDSGKLIDFLEKNFSIDWVKTAKIEKIDDGKTIRVYTEKNSLSLKLNDEKTEVNLKIGEGGADRLITKPKNGKLNIFSEDSELKIGATNKLIDSDLIFKNPKETKDSEKIVFEDLKSVVDSIVDMPIRYIPKFIKGDSLIETAKPFKNPPRLILTSPPYGDLKDYDEAEQVTSKKGYEKYLKMMGELWENSFGLLVPGGRLVVVIGDEVKASGTDSPHRVIPIHADIIRQCLDIGFIFLDTIIWQKVNTSESAGGGAFMGSYPYPCEVLINRDHEDILIFRKPGDTKPLSELQKDASKLTQKEWSEFITSVWKIPGEDKKLHPAPFPEKLAERLIKMFSFAGEYVLDPFSGSGTTCVSAMRLGRRSVGIDLKEEYIKTSIERVEEVKKKEKDFRYVSED